jgi:TRAP-type uncharacterized transport system substrate-binding protein
MGEAIRRLRSLSLRDLLWVVLPMLLLVGGAFWLASRFIQPAPPDRLILSTGGEGGAYQRFGAGYKAALQRYGIEVVEKPSGGSLDNLARLRDEDSDVDAGFLQGGTGQPSEDDELLSLGGLYYEPLWVFYRESIAPKGGELDRVSQLKGRRIAVGGEGSGNRHMAMDILHANNISARNAKLLDKGGLKLAEEFARGSIDAAFVVGPTQSATVWTLLHTPGLRVMSLVQADAYTRRFPYLSKIVLPRGAIDLVGDKPAKDITLVATMATLLVREDTHPALLDLLLQAATEVHGGPGVFQRPGDFPKAVAVDFPLAKEAERYYKSGKPFLQRYLPFWAATLIDRMVVMLIPLIGILIPVLKVAPGLYSWRVRSRIYRRYGELKFLEAEVEGEPGKHTREEWLRQIDAIEADVNSIPTPLAFADMLYTLKSHVALVRDAVLRKTATAS